MYREMMTKSKTKAQADADFMFGVLQSALYHMMGTDNREDLDRICVTAHKKLGDLHEAIFDRIMEDNNE